MVYQITYIADPSPEDINFLNKGIGAYASQQKGHKPLEFFGFFIRDAENKFQGGCNCTILYGCLHIESLYVEKTLRKQGYGTKLMQAAEKLGKERGCTFSTVNTMDWEALGFYQKLGYQIEFERRGYTKDSIFYFLRKEF